MLNVSDVSRCVHCNNALHTKRLSFSSGSIVSRSTSFHSSRSAQHCVSATVYGGVRRSLDYYRSKKCFHRLRSLCRTNRLANTVGQVVRSVGRHFLVHVLASGFGSRSLNSTTSILQESHGPGRHASVLSGVSARTMAGQLVSVLRVRGGRRRSVNVAGTRVRRVGRCLGTLSLVISIPQRAMVPDTRPLRGVLFARPNVHCYRTRTLIRSLAGSRLFSALDRRRGVLISRHVLRRIHNHVVRSVMLLRAFGSTGERRHIFGLRFTINRCSVMVCSTGLGAYRYCRVGRDSGVIPVRTHFLISRRGLGRADREFNRVAGQYILCHNRSSIVRGNIRCRGMRGCLGRLWFSPGRERIRSVWRRRPLFLCCPL